MAKVAIVFFLVALTGVFADPRGCPHPDEARNLVFEERVTAGPPDSGRHTARVEVPATAIRDHPITCITVVAHDYGSTPDILGAGDNREQGLSVILHSRERSPLDVSLFVYTA